MQAKRTKLIVQIRSSKPGSGEERRLAAKWNTFMPARNAFRYPAPVAGAIPVVLLVHKASAWLERALRLYGRVVGLNASTLVLSHRGTDEGAWALAEAISYCRVRQLLFLSAGGFKGAPAHKLHFAWTMAQVYAQLEAEEVRVHRLMQGGLPSRSTAALSSSPTHVIACDCT